MLPEVKALLERLISVESRLNSAPHAKDGRDGRDGTNGADGTDGARGERGFQGERGATGDAGRDGKDGKDGADGKDGRDGSQGPAGRDGRDGRDGKDGERGQQGQDGQQGPKGDRGRDGTNGIDGSHGERGEAGPPPRHEWRGTSIRFEQDDGSWGPWIDLQGQRGANGTSSGGGSTRNIKLDGGGAFDEDTNLDGQFAATDFTGVIGVGGGGAATVYAARTFNGGRSA